MPIAFNPSHLFLPSEKAACKTLDTTHTIDIRSKHLGSIKLCIPNDVRAAQINCAARGMQGGIRHHFFHTNHPSELLHDIVVFGMDIAMPQHKKFMSVVDITKKDLKNNFEKTNHFISHISVIRNQPIIAVDQEKAFIQSGYFFDQRTLQINGHHEGLLEKPGNTVTCNAYKTMRDCNFNLTKEGYFGAALEPIESMISLEEDLRYSTSKTLFQLKNLLFCNMLPNSKITPIESNVDIISPNIREFNKTLEVTEDSENSRSRKRKDLSPQVQNIACDELIENIHKRTRTEKDFSFDLDMSFEEDALLNTDLSFEEEVSFNPDAFFEEEISLKDEGENKGKVFCQSLNSAGLAIINDNSRTMQHLAARRLILAQSPFKNNTPIQMTSDQISSVIEWMKTQPISQILKKILWNESSPSELSAHQAESVLGLDHETLRDNYYHTTGLVYGFTRPDNIEDQNSAIEKMTELFYKDANQKLPAVTVSLEKWAKKTSEIIQAKDTLALQELPF